MKRIVNIFDDSPPNSQEIKTSEPRKYDFSKNNIKSNPFSYLLTDIGNQLLLLQEITTSYRKVKDPLSFKINWLQEQSFLHNAAHLYVKAFSDSNFISATKEISSDHNSSYDKWEKSYAEFKGAKDDKYILEKYSDLSKKTTDELDYVLKLKNERDEFHTKLKGAFPLMPKQLAQSFITDYQQKMTGESSDPKEITKLLIQARDLLSINSATKQADYINKLAKEMFSIEFYAGRHGDTPELRKSLKENIENIIGRAPASSEVENYIGVHKLRADQKVKQNIDEEVEDIDKHFVQKCQEDFASYREKNFDRICAVSSDLRAYATDSDYLKMLEQERYLVQIRTYKKLNLSISEGILLAGEAGIRKAVPGANTTIEITPRGSATLLVGELASYKKIANKIPETLKHYKAWFKNPINNTIEQEPVFDSLMKIEDIRNSSSLLTARMFFDLSEEQFQPVRVAATRYDFKDIAKKMSMAMKGAVAASLYLEQIFGSDLIGKSLYDHRVIDNISEAKKQALIFDTRNKLILFDWLSHKMGIAKIVDSLAKVQAQDTAIGINGWNCTIVDQDTKTNVPVELQLQNKEGYKVILKKGKKLFEEIKSYLAKEIADNFKTVKSGNTYKLILEKEDFGEFVIKKVSKSQENNYTLQTNTGNEVVLGFQVKLVKKVISIENMSIKGNKLIENFSLTEINSFPLAVFNELFLDWYRVELKDLKGQFIGISLKAAAEPKDPDTNRDQPDNIIDNLLGDFAGRQLERGPEGTKSELDIENSIIGALAEELSTINIYA